MKKQLMVMLITVTLFGVSCKKNNSFISTTDHNINSQQTEVPASMLTADGKYWRLGTVHKNNPYNKNSDDSTMVLLKFKPGGYFEKLVHVVTGSEEMRISIEGTVSFVTVQGLLVFRTHAAKGSYHIRKNGEENIYPVPAGDLSNLHSGSFLWQPAADHNNPELRFFNCVDPGLYPQVSLDDIARTLNPDWVKTFYTEK